MEETRLWSIFSTTSTRPAIIRRSPSFGMQDMCLITQPPTVVAPFIRKGTRHSALWARIMPGIRTEPSGRYSTFPRSG